jgi:hypothetical protein
MKEGTIFAYSGRHAKAWINRIVAAAIMYFTGSEFTHIAIWLLGRLWEVTVWHTGRGWIFGWKQGVRCHAGVPEDMIPTAVYEPVRDLTEAEVFALGRWLEWTRDEGLSYSVLKLLSLALVYPTRWFWKRIGWVPFGTNLFDEVCSSYPAEGYAFLGYEVLPGWSEELIVPGTYASSPFFAKGEFDPAAAGY